jgi:uncharacterized membrane protein YphA (DoxX/SURF4 family)
MEKCYMALSLAGRIFLAHIFLISAVTKLAGSAGVQQYMAAHGIPATLFFLSAAIVFELVGGLSVLLGYWSRIGAIVLLAFLIPTTIIFHTELSDRIQMIMFMKNLAIMGGLFTVIAHGSGKLSLDTLIHRSS